MKPTTLRALTVRYALAGLLLALAAAVVFIAKIGPVVLTLSATHGVHAGDALAVVPVLVALALVAPRGRQQVAA